MKGLLDRLMARQAKLMADLHPAPTRHGQAGPSRSAQPPVGAAERAARLAAEDQALSAAVQPLARGALDEAAALLEPHVDRAQDTRTLTTLSRIRSQQGNFDEALRLLQNAEALDPSDQKVAFFMGELLQSAGRHRDEIHYRRRGAFSKVEASVGNYVKLIGAIVNAAATGKAPPTGELRVILEALRKAPDVTPSVRFNVAQKLYRAPNLAATALAWLEEALPCPADERQIAPHWHTMGAWCQSGRASFHAIDDAGTPGCRPMVAELRDVLMHPHLRGTPILEDGRAILDGFDGHKLRKRPDDLHPPLLLDSFARAVLRLPREIRTIDEPALYVGGTGDHALDLLEHCGSLAVVDALGICGDLPLVLNEPVAPSLRELLSLLELDQRRWILVPGDTPVRFSHLWLPGRLLMKGLWVDPLLPRWYQRRFMNPGATTPSRKLFVSDATALACPADADAVMRLLTPLGFERLEVEGLGVHELMEAFGSARELVMPYGSAMANLVFTAPGARVILLADKRTSQGAAAWEHALLARAAGHEVHIVAGQASRVTDSDVGQRVDLQFDSNDILSVLSSTAAAP